MISQEQIREMYREVFRRRLDLEQKERNLKEQIDSVKSAISQCNSQANALAQLAQATFDVNPYDMQVEAEETVRSSVGSSRTVLNKDEHGNTTWSME